MNCSTFRNGLRGVLVAGVILSLLLVVPAAVNWAGRDGHQAQLQNAAAKADEVATQKWFRMHPRLTAQPRPEGLTPFGRDFKADPRTNTRGLIATTVGFLNLKNPSAVLDRLPAEFKAAGPGFRSHSKGACRTA